MSKLTFTCHTHAHCNITVPVSWSSQGPYWGCEGVQRNWRASLGQQPCYLEGLDPVSLSAWQRGDWGGRPWWQRVRGGWQRVGAPENPQNMKTQGEEERSLERDKPPGPPHCLWDPAGLSQVDYCVQIYCCIAWVGSLLAAQQPKHLISLVFTKRSLLVCHV